MLVTFPVVSLAQSTKDCEAYEGALMNGST